EYAVPTVPLGRLVGVRVGGSAANAGTVQLVTRLALVADAGEKVEVPFETVITYGPPGGRLVKEYAPLELVVVPVSVVPRNVMLTVAPARPEPAEVTVPLMVNVPDGTYMISV